MLNLPKRRQIESCRDGNPTDRSKQGDKEEWKLKKDEKTPIRGQEMTDIETDRMTEGKRAWAHHLTLCRPDWWLTEGRWQAFHVGDLCHPWRHHCLHFFTLSLHSAADTRVTSTTCNLLEVSKIWDCTLTHKQTQILPTQNHTHTHSFREITQRVCFQMLALRICWAQPLRKPVTD